MESRVNVSHVFDGGEIIGQGGFGQIHAFASSEDQDFKNVLGTVNNLVVTMNDGKEDDKAKKYVLQHIPSFVFKKFDDASADSELVFEDISNTIVHESVDLALNQNIDPSLKSLFSKVGISTQDIDFIEKYTPLSSEVRQVFSQDKLKHFLIYKRYDGDLISMIDQIPWSDATLSSMLSSVLALLCVLHANGFYHMDIKPENILYKKSDGTFCLADYGLISDSWVKQGTLEYMSPLLNTPDENGRPGIVVEDGTYITFEKASDAKGSTYTIFGMTRNEFFNIHDQGKDGGGLLRLAGKVVGTMGRAALSTVGTAATMFGRVALSPLALAIRSARSLYRMVRPKDQKVFFSRRFSVHPVMKTRLEPKKQINAHQPPAELPEENEAIYEHVENDFRVYGFTLPKHDLFALGLTLEDILQNIQLPQNITDKYRKIAKRMVYAVENEGLKPFETAKQVLQELHEISQDMPVHVVETVPMSNTSPNSKIKAMEIDDAVPSDIKALIQGTLDACIDNDQDMTVAIKNFLQVHHAFQRYRGNSTIEEAFNIDKEYVKLLSNRKRGEGIDLEVVYEMCLYYELLRMFYKLQRQNAIMEKGFGKLKTKLMNSTFKILPKSEDMQDIKAIISKYYDESSFPTLLNKLSMEIIKLGTHVIDAIQGVSHSETGLKEIFKSATQISTDTIIESIYKELDIDEIRQVYQRQLNENKVNMDLSDLHTNDVFDTSIMQGEQFYVMILLRSFKLEMDYWKRMFALHVALLRCTQFGADCSLPMSEEEKIRKQLRQVLQATSRVYDSFIRMFKAEKKTVDISLPLTAQDRIEGMLSKQASHLHMKFANVAAKFLQYAGNKRDAEGFQKRLCKYLDQLPLEYTDKTDKTIEQYTKHLENVYKTSVFGVNTKAYTSPYADLKLKISSCDSTKTKQDVLDQKVERLVTTTRLLQGVQDQYNSIRDIVSGNVDEIRKFIGSLDARMVDTLDNALKSDDLIINDTIRRFGYDGQQKYIQFVKFYENVSGAVRVFIRLKDNDTLARCPHEVDRLQNLKCDAVVYSNEKKTEKWAFAAPNSLEDIVILNESELKLRDEAKNELVTFGPFFKVIPPYTRISSKYKRVDNNVIADKFVDVGNMAQLLTGDVQNLVLFTYGYSGSGKTYTLFGNIKDMSSHDGIVYSIIDSIQKVVISNDPENPDDITIPQVTLKQIHQVYGYITSELTLLEPEKLNKSDPKNLQLPQGTYHGLLKETLESYMSRSDANKENLEDDFIKKTPNNPDSSRGFLIVEFEIATKVKGQDQVNKLCVVDMAGNEHPYDILMKTIPTFNLPLIKNAESLLTSPNMRDKDVIISKLSNKLTHLLSLLSKNVKDSLQDLTTPLGAPAFQQSTFKFYQTATDKVRQMTKMIDPYTSINKVFQQLQPEIGKAYNLLFREFEALMHLVLIRYAQYFGSSRKFKLKETKRAVLRDISRLVKMNGELIDITKQSEYLQGKTTGKLVSNEISQQTAYENTAFRLFDVQYFDDIEGIQMKISMRPHDLCITLLFLYYVSTDILNDATWLYGLTGKNDLYDILQPSSITTTDRIINAKIEQILYGGKKTDNDIQLLEKCKLMKYVCNILQTHPLFRPTFKVTPDKSSTSENSMEVLMYSKFAITDANNPRLGRDTHTVSDEGINRLFANKVIKVLVPGNDKIAAYEIIALSSYFERIIREGYYINQVNYELIRFFFLRGMSDDVINRDKLSTVEINYDKVTIEKYNSMLHIDTQKPVDEKVAATQPWCMTSMLSKLHQILNDGDDSKEENNKYMMICNVRPEPNKFRLGAFQTLELVKTLSST